MHQNEGGKYLLVEISSRRIQQMSLALATMPFAARGFNLHIGTRELEACLHICM